MKVLSILALLGGLMMPLSVITQIENLPQQTGFFDYQIPFQQDTLSFLVSSGGRDADPRKLVIYLQGSLPMPLFIEDADGAFMRAFPIDYWTYHEEYYFCIIPKPGVPIVEKASALSDQNLSLDPVTQAPSRAYQERNHLDYYVERAQAVLEYWTEKKPIEEVIVIGGSEGARVGARFAATSDLVTHLIYYSADPLGRFYEKIDAEQKAALAGTQSMEVARHNIEELFEEWEEKNKDPLSTATEKGDTNRAWTSFSSPAINDLLQLNIPVLVCYGTADSKVTNMNFLRFEAIRLGKSNLEFRSFENHDHGLNKLTFNQEGEVVSSEYVFDTIYAEWLNWIREH